MMEQKPTRQSIVIAFLILISIPFLSTYSSKAGISAENYFSSYVYKIGVVGGATGFSLGLFLEIVALLISITIIIVSFAIPIGQIILHAKKKNIYLLLTLSNLLKLFICLHIQGFFVSFSMFTIDTIKGMMM